MVHVCSLPLRSLFSQDTTKSRGGKKKKDMENHLKWRQKSGTSTHRAPTKGALQTGWYQVKKKKEKCIVAWIASFPLSRFSGSSNQVFFFLLFFSLFCLLVLFDFFFVVVVNSSIYLFGFLLFATSSEGCHSKSLVDWGPPISSMASHFRDFPHPLPFRWTIHEIKSPKKKGKLNLHTWRWWWWWRRRRFCQLKETRKRKNIFQKREE